MATPYNGRYCWFSAGTSAMRTELMGHWEINLGLDELDASEFGSVWKKSMNGMQGWTGTVSGFLYCTTAAGSTQGQYQIQTAAMNQTKLQDVRFWLDSTVSGTASTARKFWMPNYSSDVSNYSTEAGCYIGTVNMVADKNAITTVSYSVRGYGPLGLYEGTSSSLVVG